MLKLAKMIGFALTTMLLVACQQQKSDLSAYVAEVKARPPAPVPDIPVLKPYQKFEYAASELHNPFLPVVVDLPEPVEEEEEVKRIDNGIRPDLNRAKEALEQFDLASLTVVGTLEQESIWALVRSPEGVIHRVQVGNHMGKNYGEILTISDAGIAIKETVPDSLGGYIYREQSIPVRE